MQLTPGETFAIVRQLADPSDTGTYYVRATIRNARTDALIDTKDLTDRGGQRFSVEYQVPSKSSDPVWISISTRVYTDSGYTTLNTVYGQEIETHLVELRQQHFGGGGAGVSYKKIEEIVRAVVKETEKDDVDITGIVERAIRGAVGDIKGHTEQVVESARTVVPAVDFSSVLSGIERTSKILEQVMTEMPKTVREELAPHMKDLSASIEDVQGSIDTTKSAVDKSVNVANENHGKLLDIFKKGSDATLQKMRDGMVKKLQAIIEVVISLRLLP